MMRNSFHSATFRTPLTGLSLWFVFLLAGCGSPQTEHVATLSTVVALPSNAENGANMPTADSDSDELIAPVVITGPAVGQYAPRINAEFVVGHGPVTLEEARDKVVIVDFWATFCAPCQKTFPKYQALLDQFAPNLAIIAVSVDDDETNREQLEEFAHMTRVKFPIVWDKEHRTAEAYRVSKMPTSFVIDKRGVILHIHAGSSGDTAAEIAREIRPLATQ